MSMKRCFELSFSPSVSSLGRVILVGSVLSFAAACARKDAAKSDSTVASTDSATTAVAATNTAAPASAVESASTGETAISARIEGESGGRCEASGRTRGGASRGASHGQRGEGCSRRRTRRCARSQRRIRDRRLPAPIRGRRLPLAAVWITCSSPRRSTRDGRCFRCTATAATESTRWAVELRRTFVTR